MRIRSFLPGERRIAAAALIVSSITSAFLLVSGPEALAADCPLGAVEWIGATAGGDGTTWGDNRNWSTQMLPGPADHVCIVSASELTLTPAGTSVQSINADPTVSFIFGDDAFSITDTGQPSMIGGDVTMDSLFGSGNLTVAAPTTVGGSLAMIGGGDAKFTGGVDVAGEISITGSTALLYLDAPSTTGSLVLDGAFHTSGIRRTTDATAGSLVVSGPFTWGTGRFEAGIQVTVNGPSTWNNGTGGTGQINSLNTINPPNPTVLTLNGDTTWNSGAIVTSGPSQIVNNATFTINHDAVMATAGNPATFTNNATITVNNTGTTRIEPVFDNNGVLEIGSDSELNAADYVQSADGTLEIELIGDEGPGLGHGYLTGDVELAGTLAIDVQPGFMPVSQSDYELVVSTGLDVDDLFTTLVDIASGNVEDDPANTAPPNRFDGLGLTWEVDYNVGSTVNLHLVNVWPLADAGADQIVTVGAPVILDGSGSSDVDGDILTYDWSITATPAGSAAALTGATSVDPQFTPTSPGITQFNWSSTTAPPTPPRTPSPSPPTLPPTTRRWQQTTLTPSTRTPS